MARALTPKIKTDIRRSNTEMVLSTLILLVSLFMAGCYAVYGIATGNFMTAAVPTAFAVIFLWLITPTLLFNCLWIGTRIDEFAGRYANVATPYLSVYQDKGSAKFLNFPYKAVRSPNPSPAKQHEA